MKQLALIVLLCLLSVSTAGWAAERFYPHRDCTSEDRGEYPWNYDEIVMEYIKRNFFDPRSVTDLKISKPSAGHWTTAAFKMTKNNTSCHWVIFFEVNAKNRMGAYVGLSARGLWISNWGDQVVHTKEFAFMGDDVVRNGEIDYKKEVEKLPKGEQGKHRKIDLRYLSESDDEDEEESETPSYIAELKALAALRDDGIISEAEFQKQKTEILSRN